MPSYLRKCNYVDDALRSQLVHYIYYDGLYFTNISEHYGYSYETIKNIAIVFEEND